MDKRILLEALITEREGMIAENTQRVTMGESLAFVDTHFELLANRMRALTNNASKEDGKIFIRVPPRGTTQMCSQCGAIVLKDLRDRVHKCPFCGLEMDRDENAARNILARGLEQLGLCQPEVTPVEKTPLGAR